ncbi:MAG TPA: hypothetical protein VNA69_15910 [Thermoanaerobaculia bacterium]|nr:hypothetical protein [Thermoanaerobaculia bacterium]
MKPADVIAELEGNAAFAFGEKEWLGARVMTAIRLSWGDLDPEDAARRHA